MKSNIEFRYQIYFIHSVVLFVTFYTTCIAILNIFYTHNYKEALGAILYIGGMYVSVFLIKKGYPLAGRIAYVSYAILIELCLCITFSHHSHIVEDFLTIGLSTIFVFKLNEKKWIYLLSLISVSIYLLEISDWVKYLPNYHLAEGEFFDIENFNYGLYLAIFIFIPITLFLRITYFKERDLQLMQKKLNLKNRQIIREKQNTESILNILSHDLKTPISNSQLLLKMIKDKLMKETLTVQENQELLSDIETQLENAKENISNSILVNKNIHGELNIERFDLDHLLHKIKKELELKYPNSKIIFEISSIQIESSKFVFESILVNLISNGLNHNLSLNPLVRVEAQQMAKKICVTIQDNGSGISIEKFKKYFNSKVTFAYNNSGIGLFTVFHSCSRIGAELQLKESNVNGSKFELTLNV